MPVRASRLPDFFKAVEAYVLNGRARIHFAGAKVRPRLLGDDAHLTGRSVADRAGPKKGLARAPRSPIGDR
jgi:hypothetical protein